MPCPACVGVAGTVVLGGGEILLVRDPCRIRNWSILMAVIIAWILYFLAMRGETAVRITLEAASFLVIVASVARVSRLRAQGVHSLLHLWLARVWSAAAAMMNHPLVLLLKILLLGLVIVDWAVSSVTISMVWYSSLITLLVILFLIRIPRGIERWRASDGSGCPFGFKKAR